jgi:hypothetical protein
MKKMKIIISLFIVGQLFFPVNNVLAQDEADNGPKPERKAFESAVLLENQTDVVNTRNTLEWNIQHRFGTVNTGSSDLYGLFAASNIRLGFSYSIAERLGIGFGLSKIRVTNPYIDFNIKYKILQQMRSGWPWVNLTYYGSAAVDTRSGDNFEKGTHRLSYFHELIASRRISYKFSVQVGLQYSHFNAVDTLFENDMFGISIGARYKVSPQTSIVFEWTEPTLEHNHINAPADSEFYRDTGPKRNISLGVEIATSSHAFQIFISTYRDILPQYNLHYNTNEFISEIDGKNKLSFLFGFNMTRLWNF